MVMDPSFQRYSDEVNGLRFSITSSVPNQNLVNSFKLQGTTLFDCNYIDFSRVPPDWDQTNDVQDSSECPDFSDTVLKYISQMLMEEDMEEKSCMNQESSALLQAAEKPFYEILGKKYPPSPNHHPLDHNIYSWLDYTTSNSSTSSSSSSSSSSNNPSDSNVFSDLGAHFQNVPINYTLQSTPQSYLNPSNAINLVVDVIADSPLKNTINVPDMYCEHEPQWHFKKGVEEASKFLPSGTNLFVSLESNGSVRNSSIRERNSMVVKEEKKKDDKEDSPNGSRGKKNLHRVDIDLEEGRSNKHSAAFADEPLRSEIFDRILLCGEDKRSIDEHVANLQETLKTLKTEAGKNGEQNGQSKPSNGTGKPRGRKQGEKKDVVDLRTLLVHCAQVVAGGDHRSATDLLKQIRQHSSPCGDGNQRLAHYFANGLEARLAGTGTHLHTSQLTLRTSPTDILKAFQLYVAACPFKKMSYFFSNQSIMNLTGNATTLHIVDFGIAYGLQWPSLIQQLSARPGGPPKLRITGIEIPQPGFKPAERVEETGRRLASYAQSFNVPFEFNAIGQKWETIQVEDIKIKPGEVLVVNCMHRFKYLLDETVALNSPRNTVLELIRKMNPTVFIQAVVNGSYNVPFFTTRFREALYHYSSIFDMLETTVPREHPERFVLERDVFGYEALNVIACEGSERTDRPETYKQWQVRNTRAGFEQIPLQQECMKKARDRVKSFYHKDFVIDQDGQWMLQGWKGRIIHGISCWRPVNDS